MSLSDLSPEDQALVERVFKSRGYTGTGIVQQYPETLADIIAAARAEGVAALQQASRTELANALRAIQTSAVEKMEALEDDETKLGAYKNGFQQGRIHGASELRAAVVALSPLPQQTALVEKGVEKIIGPHEPAACGASAPSEPPRSSGHDWIPSRLGHGESVCCECGITNREAAAIGELGFCKRGEN